MATTGERNTHRRTGESFAHDLADGATIHKGAIVALATGLASAASTAVGLVCVGIANWTVSKADGDAIVVAELGTFKVANSTGADEITRANIGQDCFIVDDETVAATDGAGTRSRAGKVRAIEPDGVWVEFG